MGYLVLARKWRPLTFDQVVGQDHVTSTLANAIKADRLAHAYLFTGPRGVGKTTTARILARALNCDNGPTPTPCGECDGCKSITSGSNLDVLEIDGASNRGIDNVRDLREKVRYAPSEGRYKVYIVDEVHMLSKEAFNAFLKTLEEPPAHVVFIFATTSPEKIPVTILSRCQRFDFWLISAEIIQERLAKISKTEGFDINDAALALLARKARGSLRDAETLLDQVTSTADGPLDEKAVVDLLGVGDSDLFFGMCDHIGGSDTASALRGMDEAFRSGLDTGEFVLGLQEHLRSLFLLTVDPGLKSALDVPASELGRLKEQASRFGQKELLNFMEITSQTAGVMKRSDDPRFFTELALAKMCEMGTEHGLGDILRRLEELEGRLGGDGPEGGGRAEGGSGADARGGAKTSAKKAGPGKTKKTAGAGETDTGQAEQGVAGADAPPADGALSATVQTPVAEADTIEQASGAGGHPGAQATEPETGAGVQQQEATPAAVLPEGATDAEVEPVSPISVELLQPHELSKKWEEVVTAVTKEKTYLGNFLAVASPIGAESGAFKLGFPEECSFHKDRVAENANRRLVQKVVHGVFGKFLHLHCVTSEKCAKPAEGHVESQAAATGGRVAATDGPPPAMSGGPAWAGDIDATAGCESAPYQSDSGPVALAMPAAAGPSEAVTTEAAYAEETASEAPLPETHNATPADDPVRRVLNVFDGEIVEGPGAGS